MTYYVTADSFGSELPENWGAIADYLNQLIDELGIEEDHNACNELWEDFWHEKLDMKPDQC